MFIIPSKLDKIYKAIKRKKTAVNLSVHLEEMDAGDKAWLNISQII